MSEHSTHKDLVLKDIHCYRQKIQHRPINADGRITIDGKVDYCIPEPVVSITLHRWDLYAVTARGNLYTKSRFGIVSTKVDLPEPIATIKIHDDYLFALTAEGTLYYRLLEAKEWYRVNVGKTVVNIVWSTNDKGWSNGFGYLSCYDGHWLKFHPEDGTIYLNNKRV